MEMTLDLLSNNQAVFVIERLNCYQFKLVKEMIKGFNQEATPRCFCMSVDLKKAFDIVPWIVTEKTLEGF